MGIYAIESSAWVLGGTGVCQASRKSFRPHRFRFTAWGRTAETCGIQRAQCRPSAKTIQSSGMVPAWPCRALPPSRASWYAALFNLPTGQCFALFLLLLLTNRLRLPLFLGLPSRWSMSLPSCLRTLPCPSSNRLALFLAALSARCLKLYFRWYR